MSALGRPQDMFSDTAIQLQPIFAQWIQNTHYFAPNITAYNADFATTPAWGGEILAVGGKVAMMPIKLGTADFLVHHIHAFTIHVTVLIVRMDYCLLLCISLFLLDFKLLVNNLYILFYV